MCVCVCVCVRMWSGFVNTAINRTPMKAGSGLNELKQSFDRRACRLMESASSSLRATA